MVNFHPIVFSYSSGIYNFTCCIRHISSLATATLFMHLPFGCQLRRPTIWNTSPNNGHCYLAQALFDDRRNFRFRLNTNVPQPQATFSLTCGAHWRLLQHLWRTNLVAESMRVFNGAFRAHRL